MPKFATTKVEMSITMSFQPSSNLSELRSTSFGVLPRSDDKGGEDVKFIARRLIISAAEDIGLANPNALMLANETFSAVERVGWPESRIILSQCTICWPLLQNPIVPIWQLARRKN